VSGKEGQSGWFAGHYGLLVCGKEGLVRHPQILQRRRSHRTPGGAHLVQFMHEHNPSVALFDLFVKSRFKGRVIDELIQVGTWLM
jgi:hypothetical protein